MFRRILIVLVTLVLILAAGWLALRRADIPYDTLETLYASEASQFMTLSDGMKLHYRDEGESDAPTLVLVHGFSASLHTWEPWVARLKDEYRVISLDLPGHGLSRSPAPANMHPGHFADVIAEVTGSLDAQTYTLVGNSMGGATAWQFALKHAERLDGLVLVAASGWANEADAGDDRPLVFKLLANPAARWLMKDLDMTGLVRGGLQNSFVDQSLVTDSMVERYVSLSRAPGHRAGILAMTVSRQGRVEATSERLSAITVPTLILQGNRDNLVAPSGAEKFAAAITGSELKLYENVGHVPQEEIADRSVADLRDFLDRRVYSVVEVSPEESEAEATLSE